MSVALLAFFLAFVMLAQIESITRIMIAGGFLLLVFIGLSGALLEFVCDMFFAHRSPASRIAAIQQGASVLPQAAAMILYITGGLAGMLTGMMAAVPAAIGALFVVHDWNSSQNLAYYIRFTHVLTYLYSFLVGYFCGTAVKLAFKGTGAMVQVLVGLAVGLLIFSSAHQLLVYIIEPARRGYLCVFGY